MNTERKIIEVELFDCTYDSPVTILEKLRREWPNVDPTKCKVDVIDTGWYETSYHAAVVGPRPETDAEMAKRLKDEQDAAKHQEAYDKAQWERLKKKFGDKKDG